METDCPDTSILDNAQIWLVGPQIQQENYVTRAIIELSGDIAPCLPHLSRVIENCGYRPDVETIAFRLWDMPVVIQSNTITINNLRDMKTAHRFLDWLKSKMAEPE